MGTQIAFAFVVEEQHHSATPAPRARGVRRRMLVEQLSFFERVEEPIRLLPLLPDGQRRKCSALPRPRTHNLHKLSATALAEIKRGAAAVEAEVAAARPRTRAECEPCPTCEEFRAQGEPAGVELACGHDPATAYRHCRPCAFMGCRHHLAIDVHEESGHIKERFPHLRVLEQPEALALMADTCCLDVAARVEADGEPLAWEEVGKSLNVGVERSRQLAARGLQAMRVADLRDEHLRRMR